MKNLNFPGLPRILVIDADQAIREGLRSLLQAEGLAVEIAADVDTGLRRIGQKPFDIVLADLDPDDDQTLASLRKGSPPSDVVLLGGAGTPARTVDAMRIGASDVVEKPFPQDRMLAVIRRCLESRQVRHELLRAQDRLRELTSTEIIGLSPALRELQSRVEQVAQAADATVLVTGEGGSGKELVARCVHARSSRRHGPFVAVNCAASAANLLEAELFGYEAGAFAGGDKQGKHGLFAIAAGGTLLLDEIAAMDKSLQAKLLRVLQDRSYKRVGGVQDLCADVRIIATTGRDLQKEVEAGRFREDLYYRLNAMTVAVPALRNRSEDVPLLAHFYLDLFGRQMGKNLTGFTEEATETLCEHEWPGNVRELKNAIEHAAIVCPGGMIDECHLPAFSGGRADGSDRIQRNVIVLDSADCSIRRLESQLVDQVLDLTKWNISRAASMLGINRTTLYNKIRLYNLGARPNRTQVGV